MASWDITMPEGSDAISGPITQLGVWLPHGKSFLQCVAPEDANEMELASNPRYVKLQDKWCMRHQGSVLPMLSISGTVAKLIEFLEMGCKITRPPYEKVVLLCHYQESIPRLLRAVKKAGLQDKFRNIVAGMGDTCSYLAQCHMKKFLDQGVSVPDLSLKNTSSLVLGMQISYSKSSDTKAKGTYEIIEKLLKDKPNFSNFFSKFINSMNSKLMKRLSSLRTLQERMGLFLPLKQYISEELAREHVELIIEGVYAPTVEEVGISSPQVIGNAMCRILVHSSFDFDQLMNIYTTKGLEELELKLRTVFLEKMSGQPRAIVDQTIRTTRLVIKFFRENGHKTMKDIMKQAQKKQAEFEEQKRQMAAAEKDDMTEVTQKGEEPEAIAEKIWAEASEKLPSLAATNQVGGVGSLMDIALKATSAATAKPYLVKAQDYSALTQFIRMKFFSKKMKMPQQSKKKDRLFSTDSKIKTDMMINALINANIEHKTLVEMYVTDKVLFKKNRNHLRSALAKLTETQYNSRGPSDIPLDRFITILIHYCGQNLKMEDEVSVKYKEKQREDAAKREAAKREEREAKERRVAQAMLNAPGGWMKAIEEKETKLKEAIDEVHSNEYLVGDLNSRIRSLQSLKLYFVKELDQVLRPQQANSGDILKIGDNLAKLVAFVGYNHYRLKELWDRSLMHFTTDLDMSLTAQSELLPPGLTTKVVIDAMVEYFQKNHCVDIVKEIPRHLKIPLQARKRSKRN